MLTFSLIALCFSMSLHAQSSQQDLDQVELMKQFIGRWKAEMGKDTIAIAEYKPYGTGIDGYIKIETKGETIMEGRQLFGYDKKTDKIIQAELYKGSDIILWAGWFTSKDMFIGVPLDDISNPEKAVIRVEGDFKSPDLYIHTQFVNNKPISVITLYREQLIDIGN